MGKKGRAKKSHKRTSKGTSKRRSLPLRNAHITNSYANISSSFNNRDQNIADTVDEILDQPTLEEKLSGKTVVVKKATPLPAATAQKPDAHEEKGNLQDAYSDDSSSTTSDDSSRTRSSRRRRRSRSPRRRNRRESSGSRRSGGRKKGTEVLEVSSTDSHRSGDVRSPSPVRQSKSKDMRSTKEARRLDNDADKHKEAAKQQKAISNYIKQVAGLKDNLKEKEDEFEELKLNHEVLKQKFKQVDYENGRIRGALQKVRENPEEFASQLAKKGSRGKRKVGPTMDDASTKSGMISLGKEAVKSVWRVYKFINTKAHEEIFIHSVLDHLGKEEFLSYPNDTEERKSEVLEKRLECIEYYGKAWVSELNVHRTYVQVSTKQLRKLMSRSISDLSSPVL